MNYYPFHLGDYAAHTKHLSLLEDLAYRRMIDLYYTAEKPLPSDPENVARLIGMRENSTIVTEVLSDFFLKSEEGYRSKRCDREIKKYKAKADRARSANNKRWKSETHLKSDMKSESFQIPTNNQKPITKINVKGKNLHPFLMIFLLRQNWSRGLIEKVSPILRIILSISYSNVNHRDICELAGILRFK